MSEALLILTNLPGLAEAEALARDLVERKFAACVNILPVVQSVYRWQGMVKQANEVTLLIKTAANRYAELEAAIKAAHPYALPEIVAIPIAAGLPAYLNWITAETQKDVNV
ncbi:divalent-cation tolerance protein CutA [Collimonas arenae]|uniref:Divalent-cation tolerance protein CutA n=2 Tax=Collimonas arenae TaxID=279058 RepID=A0A127PKF5_9BURK|nr:divalent-cation tolerance protein CutA [Collimonas arenae]AMO98292.1 divalent-cation tolerance protein CutA [Collimonas arenae]AMP08166.1 divalent-cation tolerance protein CutA [Collimonas arenae]